MNKLCNKLLGEKNIIDLSYPHLVDYWTEHLGVTEKLLKEAIEKVGNSVDTVEEYIAGIVTYYYHTYAM